MQDKRHGKGVKKYVNGDIYDGYWNNDLKEGYGTFKWNNGDIYVG